jgi:glycosidase
VEEGGLDTVVNTELRKLAIGNRICSKQEASLAECANEIVADLLLFHQQKRRRGGGHGPSTSSSSVWPVWSLGSPFTQRLASRLHGQRAMAELLVMLELVLPGTPMVYYGEERGQRNCHCHGCKVGWLFSGHFTVHSSTHSHGSIPSEDLSVDRRYRRKRNGPPPIPQRRSMWDHFNGIFQTNSFAFQPFGPDDFLRNFRRVARLRQRSKTLASGEAYITKPQGQQAFALCRYLQNEEEGEEEGHFGVFGQVRLQ